MKLIIMYQTANMMAADGNEEIINELNTFDVKKLNEMVYLFKEIED